MCCYWLVVASNANSNSGGAHPASAANSTLTSFPAPNPTFRGKQNALKDALNYFIQYRSINIMANKNKTPLVCGAQEPFLTGISVNLLQMVCQVSFFFQWGKLDTSAIRVPLGEKSTFPAVRWDRKRRENGVMRETQSVLTRFNRGGLNAAVSERVAHSPVCFVWLLAVVWSPLFPPVCSHNQPSSIMQRRRFPSEKEGK